MSRIAAIENIYDTLVENGLDTDHAIFDDIVMGCLKAAVDPAAAGKEVTEIIFEMQDHRDKTWDTEEELCMDLADYKRVSGAVRPIGCIMDDAVMAGLAGWNNGYELRVVQHAV